MLASKMNKVQVSTLLMPAMLTAMVMLTLP